MVAWFDFRPSSLCGLSLLSVAREFSCSYPLLVVRNRRSCGHRRQAPKCNVGVYAAVCQQAVKEFLSRNMQMVGSHEDGGVPERYGNHHTELSPTVDPSNRGEEQRCSALVAMVGPQRR